MEWFDKISEFMEGLPEWLQAHPRYGYLIGDCLRMAVDILPSGKLGREFLAGYAG